MRKSVNTSNKFSTFGSTQPNPNNLNANQYRYGFGGMEQDKQTSSYTTYFRQYDPRIARWKSTDPVTQPWQSPYTAFDNNPILYVDPMGDVSWCGIGTVFSGLASFAGNMALRALPTLGLNTALNNFLPNATHTGNNSGRFFGADGNVGGGGESLKAGDRFVGNDGKTYTFSFDEFEVVDSKPVYTHPLPLGGGIISVDFFDIPFIYLEAFVGEALYSIGASESTVKYATYSIVLMSFIKGKPMSAAKGSGAGKYLLQNWHKGTFPNRTQSVSYHLAKHGKGRTATQYTQDAMNFFNKNKGLGQNVILKDGTQGIKIQTKQIINGKTHRVGGYWTKDGRLVTFWD